MHLFDYLCENCIKINTVSLWKWYEINIFINHYLTVTLQIFTYRLLHSIFDQCYLFFFQSCNHDASLTMSYDLPLVWISLIPCGSLQFFCQFFLISVFPVLFFSWLFNLWPEFVFHVYCSNNGLSYLSLFTSGLYNNALFSFFDKSWSWHLILENVSKCPLCFICLLWLSTWFTLSHLSISLENESLHVIVENVWTSMFYPELILFLLYI